MFIAIVGTPSSGKKTVLDYLCAKYEFKRLHVNTRATADSEVGLSFLNPETL